MRSFLPLLVILAITLSSLLSSQYVVEASEQFRYQVCTADELRKCVEQVCMRISTRDKDTGLSVGPFGSVSPAESPSILVSSSDNLRTTPLTDAELMQVLKASKPYARGNRKRSQTQQQQQQQHNRELRLQRRNAPLSDTELCDYLDTCCNRSCVINPMDLATFCTTAR